MLKTTGRWQDPKSHALLAKAQLPTTKLDLCLKYSLLYLEVHQESPGAAARMSFGMPASCISVSAFQLCSRFQLPADTHLRRQVMSQAVWALPAIWESQVEFLTLEYLETKQVEVNSFLG